MRRLPKRKNYTVAVRVSRAGCGFGLSSSIRSNMQKVVQFNDCVKSYHSVGRIKGEFKAIFSRMVVLEAELSRCFLAGADFLPAAGTFVELQDFFAKANRFWRYFHVFIVGDELDGLFEALLFVRNQT